MEGKKQVKISLQTVILIVCVILIIGIIVVCFMLNEIKSKENLSTNTNSDIKININQNTSGMNETNSNNSKNNETITSPDISKTKTAKLEIISYDNQDHVEKTEEIIKIKEKDKINLKKYEGNDIEVLEINDTSIKISRNATRYGLKSETDPSTGLTIESQYNTIENVIEEVKYGEEISMNIDTRDLRLPQEQARYIYIIKVTK